MKTFQQGFTLIELITVILLVAILAVTVVPRFVGSNDFQVYVYRDQLISDLRLTQQRAMQQTDSTQYCHQIVLENKRYGVPNRLDCSVTTFPTNWLPDATGLVVDDNHDITFSMSAANPNFISFNSLGQPRGNCLSGCFIQITHPSEQLVITIEAEGYIHGN